MFNAKAIVKDILKGRKEVKDIFFVACGGSLVDLYNGYFFITRESKEKHAMWINAGEFVAIPPASLDENSVVILCSHSGNTKETVKAAELAVEKGAYPIVFTNVKESKCDREDFHTVIYEWKNETNAREKPVCMTIDILNELLHETEKEYTLYQEMEDGLKKIDGIIRQALKDGQNSAWLFADKYGTHEFPYIMSSGSSYAQEYGFAICYLQEMQWMNCCYLNSTEYFHGPFELTGDKSLFILLLGAGKQRKLDLRALNFIEKYSRDYEIIDAEKYGLKEISACCVDYFNAPLFYEFSVLYRDALDNVRRHPTSMRRYMGVVEY